MMKKLFAAILFCPLFLFPNLIQAQNPDAPMFGKDIVINDDTNQNQQQVSICSAYNGWLFVGYTSYSGDYKTYTIRKSKDSGYTWDSVITVVDYLPHIVFSSFNIAVSGNTESNLKLFVGYVYFDTVYNNGQASVLKFDVLTGAFESEILHDGTWHSKKLVIVTSPNYPSVKQESTSLGILYTIEEISDSLFFRYSTNEGVTMSKRKIVAVAAPNCTFNNLALDYGKCLTSSNGQYFAAWEMKPQGSNLSHIYTSHTRDSISGIFSSPICLDSIDASMISNCRNPAIACQYAGYDNDSTDLTTVILTETFESTNSTFKIKGFYNLKGSTGNSFQTFDLSPNQNNQLQPSIDFNPVDSTFMVTFCDSTQSKLPFLTNNFQLKYPGSWINQSTGYNDNPFLNYPSPLVHYSTSEQNGVNVWIGNNMNGNGICYFDAPLSTYTDVNSIYANHSEFIISIYPNPCDGYLNVIIQDNVSCNIDISLFTEQGLCITSFTVNSQPEDENRFKLDMSTYCQGVYFLVAKSQHNVEVKKIIKI